MADAVLVKGSESVQLRLKKTRLALKNKNTFDKIGAQLKANILLRTAKGVDADGDEFEAYSKPYAKIRDAVDLPTDKVDLFFSGQMLSALSYTAEDDRVTLFFLDTPRKTKKKKSGEGSKPLSTQTNASIAFFVNELRPFFDISKQDRKDAEAIVQEGIREGLRE